MSKYDQNEKDQSQTNSNVTPQTRPPLPLLVDILSEESGRTNSLQVTSSAANSFDPQVVKVKPKVRLITPRKRPNELVKPWQDMRMFTNRSTFSTSKDVEMTANMYCPVENPPQDEFPTQATPSPIVRRLSLIPEGSTESQENFPTVAAARRRNSLTPLSYFDAFDAVEQFVEQVAGIPPEDLTLDSVSDIFDEAVSVPIEVRASAEHFSFPRNSICAGIKIEITPPSAIRDVNNFILDTVIIEVPDDDSHSYTDIPKHNSHVINIQRLTSSSAEFQQINDFASVASVTQTSSLTSSNAVVEIESQEAVSRTDSDAVAAAPPGRRRTKLIAINVRKQTFSSFPKIAKTVRFAPSPTRGVAYLIDESESLIPDRKPHLWTEELAGELQTLDRFETESEEIFVPGFLRVYDFSAKELQQILNRKFSDERNSLAKFFEAKLLEVPPLHLDALDHHKIVIDRNLTDICMQEV